MPGARTIRSSFLLALAIAFVATPPGAVAQTADAIWAGGPILTMRGPTAEYAEALAVKDGKILALGRRADVAKHAGAMTRQIDLAGHSLLPGFIDTHGHMVYFGKNLVDADLFGSKDIPDLVARMASHAGKVPEGGWIVGFGYQAKQLAEKRTPTREELDRISTEIPVMIVDSSGHAGAGNSKLFEVTGFDGESPDPAGGLFARGPDGKSLLGPMEETALNAVRSQRPPFTGALAAAAITGAARRWASFGQTTAMEAGLGLGSDDIGILLHAIEEKILPIDLYVAAKDSNVDAALTAAYRVGETVKADTESGEVSTRLLAARPDLDRRYVNRVRLGGVKFWLDGSLDTAWMNEPYTANPPGKSGEYRAYRQIPDDVLEAAFDRFWPTDFQIHMHMNGDAAADQALKAIEKAVAKHGMHDHRPVFVHATFLRDDQIKKLKAFGAVPSFLTSGLLPGGDAVVRMWGEDRAAHSMAARTMLEEGIPFTFSHDAPVSPEPWILTLVGCGVNRKTPSGRVIGPDQRIPPYAALRAVTAMAAWEIKEEKSKGTLEPGKLADLVILDKNPLEVPPETIDGIVVLETIKEGRTIWRRDADRP